MILRLCTSNEGKRREFERMLGISLELAPLELPEIQSLDVAEVCRAKAAVAFERLGHPVLVDDTGFELSNLKGFPGALVTWVIEAGGPSLLYRMLPSEGGAAAAAMTCIGLANDTGVQIFIGRVSGTVILNPRGENGFGFDPVFVPDGETRTFAEMSDEDKDGCSPRGIALAQLATYLGERY